MTNRITFVERTDSEWHRSPIIIHRADGTSYYLAEFETAEQLDFFAQTLGFTYIAESWRDNERCGIWREYKTSHRIIDSGMYFWTFDEIPSTAKPIKALSNGSIVTCYYVNDGKTITIYRPNPNAKAIYHPLCIDQHIAHTKVYGKY